MVALPALAQTTPAFYAIEFIKAKPGKLAEYKEFLHKNLPPIGVARIKAGDQLGWGLGEAVSPTGTSMDHDLVGFYAYTKFEQLERPDEQPDYMKAALKTLGFNTFADYATKRDPLRDITRTEMWSRQAGTTLTADNVPKAGEYVVITYLKINTGKAADYDQIWKTYSLPLQEDRVKAGKLRSYSMWSVMGAGEGNHYDHVSLARYASFKDIGGDPATQLPEQNALADRIHSGKDWRQMRREMVSLRSVYGTEIIKLRESVR